MRNTLSLLLIGCATLATAQPAPPATAQPAAPASGQRYELAMANARIETDGVEFYANNTLRLTGNVVVRAERVGRKQMFLYLTADRATVMFGENEAGEPTLTKAFAVGSVHLEATSEDAAIGQTQRVVTDCDRAEYVGAQDVIHLITTEGKPVEVDYHVQVKPVEGREADDAGEYRTHVVARERFDIYLTDAPPELMGPGEGQG